VDRFQYIEDEPEEFSTCANCGVVIYVGDGYYDHYGVISCENLNCLAKITNSNWNIAKGDENEI
jgi:hypothetical protein